MKNVYSSGGEGNIYMAAHNKKDSMRFYKQEACFTFKELRYEAYTFTNLRST
jgi:hypothetical protein